MPFLAAPTLPKRKLCTDTPIPTYVPMYVFYIAPNVSAVSVHILAGKYLPCVIFPLPLPKHST